MARTGETRTAATHGNSLALPGVSDTLAARIIASAAALVRDRGRRVPLGI